MSSKQNNHYDVLVIGGGITGIGIFRDLSLHGINSLLVERKNFCSETSAKSSKMLHGGIRYLEQLDFALVRDALQEKNVWLRLAPEYCFEQKFYLPLYKDSKHSPLLIRIGMFLYAKILNRSHALGSFVNKSKLKAIIPELKSETLKGAGVYTDAIVDDKELGIAVLEDALMTKVGDALEHHETTKITRENDIFKIELTNTQDQSVRNITSKFVVMATGPFTDQVAKKLIDPNWKNIMMPSKGIHLWLKNDSLKLKDSVVLVAKDNRVIFVIPQKKGILIGTTDTVLPPDFKNVEPTIEEIEYLLKETNNYFPQAKITKEHILSTYAGVRPLVKDKNVLKADDVSRHHRVLQPRDGFFVIAGGKYTTFRLMAQDIVRPIAGFMGVNYSTSKTLQSLKKKSNNDLT